MSDTNEKPAVAVGDDARHRHLEDDVRALVDAGLTFARTEADLQKARGGYAVSRIKWIALLGALAAVLAWFALVALTVGLVITLTPVLGAIWATLLVFSVLLVVAALCAWSAAGQWKRMIEALSNRDSARSGADGGAGV